MRLGGEPDTGQLVAARPGGGVDAVHDGGYQALGQDAMPDMSKSGWVKTNGEHGYGCGCMVVEVDQAAKRITRLISATPLPLARCRADHALPKP